ncbi:MAG: hypothetical protein PWP23_2450 [Candidatus Sumerlaeota bacterium]|nr:hypothetical protein [Candidatus Sumerlaeota bacterium]
MIMAIFSSLSDFATIPIGVDEAEPITKTLSKCRTSLHRRVGQPAARRRRNREERSGGQGGNLIAEN